MESTFMPTSGDSQVFWRMQSDHLQLAQSGADTGLLHRGAAYSDMEAFGK